MQSPHAYGYDDLDRLTQATNPQIAGPDETFVYDPVGNRLRRDGETTDATFDAANRLIEDEQACYAYDFNGNLASRTAKVAGACTGGVTAYTFDAEDRLVRIDLPGGGFAEYRYDGLGRRIQKDVDGVVTRYVYDGEDILLEYDGANVLLARYTHGPGTDDPVQLERDLDASGTFEATERFTYHADGLGSIIALTDSTGTVARAYVYDAYGRIVDETGTLANPFTYTSREFDSESGLFFYRARYYDAALGRFLAEDPIGFRARDENLYRYVLNNPTNLVDSNGQIGQVVLGAILGGIAGGVGGAISGGASFENIAIGAAAGAVAGAAVAAIPTIAAPALAADFAPAINFASNALASLAGQAGVIALDQIRGGCSSFNDLNTNAALGAGVGGLGGGAIGNLITMATSRLGRIGSGILGSIGEGAAVGGGELAGAGGLSR